MRSFKYLIFLLIVQFACSVEQSSQEKPQTEEPTEKILSSNSIQAAEMIKVEKKASCNEPPCTTVSIRYPRFESIPNFNKIIEETIIETLSEDFIMDADGSESMEELENMFIASYENFVANFPESTTPWDLSISVQVSYASENFTSFEMAISSYTGGAHPNSSVTFINLSKDSKRPLELKSIIKNDRKLRKIAEEAFRTHYEIPEGSSFSDFGFTFDNDQFTLPQAIGFNKEGLIIYYNSYEIASYANGPTEITIPLNKLEDLIKI
ncbi:MAG: hypothetical protein CMB80_22265 [Flammeovirgaceae bacterium]|nr:hypothetical protein [Flammeovirgaceae bacterium]MBE63478.1 hypothetical protein [Flammeovirgaceae bacterium]MBR06484.1 hypothetical protein [Rickettsiales bacterium]